MKQGLVRGVLQTVLAATVALVLLSAEATAEPLKFGSTLNPAPVGAYVAADKGYFKKQGLEVNLQTVAVDSTLPAALLSRSLDIASLSPTTFIRAVDGGLDLVAISGAAVTNPGNTEYGIAVRAGTGIKKAADLSGKKVGAPGIGSILHVMARAWLTDQGVDYKTVNFIEARFPVHGDLLKSNQLDAVISVDPYFGGMVNAKIAEPLVYFPKVFSGKPVVNVMAATRTWARANLQQVNAFRAAIRQAADFGNGNPEELRRILGNMLKLPPQVMARLELPLLDANITAAQLGWWIDVMRKQDMLKTSVTGQKLLLD